MPDEFEDVVEEQIEESPPEPEVEPEPQPQTDPMWEGRIRKEQQRLANVRAQLAQYGAQVDDDGNIITPQVQQQYQQPRQTEPDWSINWESPEQDISRLVEQKAQQIAQQQVAQALGGFMPVLDNLVGSNIKQQYSDFDDIKPDVDATLRSMGFSGYAHAMALRPDMVEVAVNAARGKRGVTVSAPQPQVNTQELERQARVAQAAQVGGGQGKSAAVGSYEFSPEERQEMIATGMSPEMYSQVAGKVQIDVLGKNKRSK